MKRRSVLVLVVQLALVLFVAAKYLWERHHCPMVWTLAGQYDPETPLRGRYMALTLHADACGLRSTDSNQPYTYFGRERSYEYDVTLIARDGKLIAVKPTSKVEPMQGLRVSDGGPCAAATLNLPTDFFVPEHAQLPQLRQGEQLWALVTVPPSGPPRPVQLAVSGADGWHPLDLR